MIQSVLKAVFEPRTAAARAVSAFIRLALVALLIAISLSAAPKPAPSLPRDEGDVALYRSVVADMRAGEDYYAASTQELRARGYPLRPFVTVRLPTLAWIAAALQSELIIRAVLGLLALSAVGAWMIRLGRANTPAIQFAAAAAALLAGTSIAFISGGAWLHEVWAGVLIALSLALRTDKSWIAAVIIGTLAALLRELAAPYLLLMAVLALSERRHREAAAWTAGLALFALTLAAHAAHVSAFVTATDRASSGWLALGGWAFVLNATHWTLFPLKLGWTIGVLLPLALLGFTARPVDLRLTLLVFGFVLGLLFLGRPDTSYWGFIIAPLWPLGLVTLWPALQQSIAELRGAPALLRRER